MQEKKIKAGIVGGTGYTGVELLRLLSRHPNVKVCAITSRKDAGTKVTDMYPSLRGFMDDLVFTTPKKPNSQLATWCFLQRRTEWQ